MADAGGGDGKEELPEKKKVDAHKVGRSELERDMSRLFSRRAAPASTYQRSHSLSPRRSTVSSSTPSCGFRFGHSTAAAWRRGSSSFQHSSPLQREGRRGSGGGRADMQYWKILQSMGQAVHIMGLDGRITYWNRSAEELYGYSESEAIGEDAMELLIDISDYEKARDITNRIAKGEGWTGKFPAKKKSGEKFLATVTNTPSKDEDGNVVGIICVSNDSRCFQELQDTLDDKKSSSMGSVAKRSFSSPTSKTVMDTQQPIQAAIASKLSNLREIATANLYASDRDQSDHMEDTNSSGASTARGEIPPSHFSASSLASHDEKVLLKDAVKNYDVEGKCGPPKMAGSKADGRLIRKEMPWPRNSAGRGANQFLKPFMGAASEDDLGEQKRMEYDNKLDQLSGESNRPVHSEAPGSWPSFNVNSSSSVSSSGSASSSTVYRVDTDGDCLDFEISWDDLTIGEHIGQGSCGTVYHALWFGSDVAVKVFSKQEYSDEVIMSFRQEVSLMKRLRHPNVLLFMGAVTSPERLCIVTEFLPRGSLFRLLQTSSVRLEWRRRVHMALDIARGVNYLHHLNPPIIHRDLKSSNLLVDKNWTVKVGDFGLSGIKHAAYLTTITGKGTPQWMAPEVLRSEQSDEKSDVYSFGVILWELVTEKIPWDNLNSMQVVAAVGFMNRRLEIPEDTDSKWGSIIESCWHSEPQQRPTFHELVERLRDLQRYHNRQLQAARAAASGDRTIQKTES